MKAFRRAKNCGLALAAFLILAWTGAATAWTVGFRFGPYPRTGGYYRRGGPYLHPYCYPRSSVGFYNRGFRLWRCRPWCHPRYFGPGRNYYYDNRPGSKFIIIIK